MQMESDGAALVGEIDEDLVARMASEGIPRPIDVPDHETPGGGQGGVNVYVEDESMSRSSDDDVVQAGGHGGGNTRTLGE